MKKILISGLLVFGVGQASVFAQTDDVYFYSADANQQQQEAQATSHEDRRSQNASFQNENTWHEERYADDKNFDNDYYTSPTDDYEYATRIQRFYHPIPTYGYWSSFYNPYGNWVDPMWGFSYWNRPGFSISFGTGPYWSSYWGMQTWYGYPAYHSAWSYPYYGYGWGSGYYHGFWDGYYTGIYGNNYRYQNVHYGPRRDISSSYSSGPAVRSSRNVRTPTQSVPNREVNVRPTREVNSRMSRTPEVSARPDNRAETNRPSRGSFSESNSGSRYAPSRQNTSTYQNRPAQRSTPEPSYRQPTREHRTTPKYQAPAARPSYQAPSRPSYQTPSRSPSINRSSPAPRMSSPARSSPSRGNFGGRR